MPAFGIYRTLTIRTETTTSNDTEVSCLIKGEKGIARDIACAAISNLLSQTIELEPNRIYKLYISFISEGARASAASPSLSELLL